MSATDRNARLPERTALFLIRETALLGVSGQENKHHLPVRYMIDLTKNADSGKFENSFLSASVTAFKLSVFTGVLD